MIRILSIEALIGGRQAAEYGKYNVELEVDGVPQNLEYTCDFRVEDGLEMQTVTWRPENSILGDRDRVDVSDVAMITDTVVQHHKARFAEVVKDRIGVRVLFFGAARDAVGKSEVDLSLKASSTAANAFEQVLEKFPDLRRFGRSLLLAVNQEYATADREVRDGDELALFPPVSGGSGGAGGDTEIRRHGDAETRTANTRTADTGTAGVSPASTLNATQADGKPHDFFELTTNPIDVGTAGVSPTSTLNGTRADGKTHDFFELTTNPIDVGTVARRVVLPECGATVTLDGYAREWTKGRQTLHLIYEAYAPMAHRELERLGREAHTRFEIAHIGIVHRTGRLEIGETSVVIAVSAPHRRAAFEACEWAIRELKRTVPIWKKEVFADGEVWVEGDSI